MRLFLDSPFLTPDLAQLGHCEQVSVALMLVNELSVSALLLHMQIAGCVYLFMLLGEGTLCGKICFEVLDRSVSFLKGFSKNTKIIRKMMRGT